jgi:antitoxin component of MazEF toxin-antitoxin module
VGAVIRTQSIKIDNSQGIRISKLLLKQSGIRTEVEIAVHGDRVALYVQ